MQVVTAYQTLIVTIIINESSLSRILSDYNGLRNPINFSMDLGNVEISVKEKRRINLTGAWWILDAGKLLLSTIWRPVSGNDTIMAIQRSPDIMVPKQKIQPRPLEAIGKAPEKWSNTWCGIGLER